MCKDGATEVPLENNRGINGMCMLAEHTIYESVPNGWYYRGISMWYVPTSLALNWGLLWVMYVLAECTEWGDC